MVDSGRGYVKLCKGFSIPIVNGDLICFGPPCKTVWKYKFKCSDASSATATSSDGSAPPSVMQRLLDSLVEIENLKQDNHKWKDTADVLMTNLKRSEKEMHEEIQERVACKLKLADVEKQLEAERLVRQGAVEALTACKQELDNTKEELDRERVISRDLERAKNELERAAKMNQGYFGTLEGKSLPYDDDVAGALRKRKPGM
jgi:hypothetical protein